MRFQAELETVQIVPQGEAARAFSFSKPKDWMLAALPHVPAAFEDPKRFHQSAVCTARHGVAVFAVSTRTESGTGPLRDRIAALCAQDQVPVEDMREVSVGPLRGVIIDARRMAGVEMIVTRNLFVEDGGRLIMVSTMASEAAFRGVEFLLAEMMESFRLAPSPLDGPSGMDELDRLFPMPPSATPPAMDWMR